MKFNAALSSAFLGALLWASQTMAGVDEPELSAEFLLYLLEFQSDPGEWVDPEALQWLSDAEVKPNPDESEIEPEPRAANAEKTL